MSGRGVLNRLRLVGMVILWCCCIQVSIFATNNELLLDSKGSKFKPSGSDVSSTADASVMRSSTMSFMESLQPTLRKSIASLSELPSSAQSLTQWVTTSSLVSRLMRPQSARAADQSVSLMLGRHITRWWRGDAMNAKTPKTSTLQSTNVPKTGARATKLFASYFRYDKESRPTGFRYPSILSVDFSVFGTAGNDDDKVSHICVRAGDLIDGILLRTRSGREFRAGGSGGSPNEVCLVTHCHPS
jgi:hypothetical protein